MKQLPTAVSAMPQSLRNTLRCDSAMTANDSMQLTALRAAADAGRSTITP